MIAGAVVKAENASDTTHHTAHRCSDRATHDGADRTGRMVAPDDALLGAPHDPLSLHGNRGRKGCQHESCDDDTTFQRHSLQPTNSPQGCVGPGVL